MREVLALQWFWIGGRSVLLKINSVRCVINLVMLPRLVIVQEESLVTEKVICKGRLAIMEENRNLKFLIRKDRTEVRPKETAKNFG